MDKMVFYFNFSLESSLEDNEDTEPPSVLKAFICENIDYSKSKYKSWADFESEVYDDLTSDIESDFGVHDWSSNPSDGIHAIGYTTYEVEAEKVDECMDRWVKALLKAFPGSSTTSVYELDDTLHGDDVIMQAVENKRKSISLKHK